MCGSRVFLKWTIERPGSPISTVIVLIQLIRFLGVFRTVGYEISTIDAVQFEKLVNSPTPNQCEDLAELLLACWQTPHGLKEMVDWPTEKGALSDFIGQHLIRSDWYSQFGSKEAQAWDQLLNQIEMTTYAPLAFDSLEMYESIDWGCIETCGQMGAEHLAEGKFGGIGYRCSFKLKDGADYIPEYGIYLPDQLLALKAEVEEITPQMNEIPDEEIQDEFWNGIAKIVENAINDQRALWVRVDA